MISILILSACIVWWVNICPIMDLIKLLTKRKRLKPFDCCTCLGWWGGLTLGIVSRENYIDIIIFSILTSFFSVIIEKVYLYLVLR
jgi:hypothetical protein